MRAPRSGGSGARPGHSGPPRRRRARRAAATAAATPCLRSPRPPRTGSTAGRARRRAAPGPPRKRRPRPRAVQRAVPPPSQDSQGWGAAPGVVGTKTMSERLVSLGKQPEARGVVRPAPAAGAPRVYVETYGCQMNVADSDLIGSVLAEAGYATAARADEADVIVVNTCAVREKAEERVIARASELGAVKRRRPGTVLAIVGCMAEHLKDGLAARVAAVD